MAFTPSKTCTTAGCERIPAVGKSKCSECLGRPGAERAPVQGGRERGYAEGWGRDFLTRNPLCYHKVRGVCTILAELPDHYPVSRKDLVAQGVENPNDERYLVASCTACHHHMTAIRQPGGWNREGWSKS